ncbi:hypothetical protein DPV78_005613 [Talaromyces pinophilus]|nr:hypothetical protein DPV78_005613 [Talaromyces pinophilus]
MSFSDLFAACRFPGPGCSSSDDYRYLPMRYSSRRNPLENSSEGTEPVENSPVSGYSSSSSAEKGNPEALQDVG